MFHFQGIGIITTSKLCLKHYISNHTGETIVIIWFKDKNRGNEMALVSQILETLYDLVFRL